MRFLAHFSPFCALDLSNMTKNIAIFASGSGSNAENIIRYFMDHETIRVALVVSTRSNAFVLERSETLGVPFEVFLRDEWASGGANVLAALQRYNIDFVVLAGFLAHIPDAILHTYPDKVINIHPSLLPKYGGKGMYGDHVHEAVVAARETETGITIHYLNERYDEGEVIVQVACPVLPEDTPQDVAAKVHALEYEHYPQVIEEVITGLL
ncbi:phosphoribosylglycinamide formyltransferase [Bacteroides sp. 51]|uniref:phosphoribosylglycinamide formyltransferase n=1 Tax=Bacteroides sp. 51 TaxID=2302938 RepID=UPI0013D725A1|nr:phosphoribosylglycinamide formyltransferase [Bacteroides sp. 51]NDV80505.1 phosphoribosylglycinamide formyltransferase [Bacteroides sp. 51]